MEQKRKVPPIINSRTIPYRDGSTLIWYKDQDITNKKFKLWTGIVTSLRDYVKWCTQVPILAVVLYELPSADIPLLAQCRASIPHLFITQAIATDFALTNCHIIESLSKQYPIVSIPITSPADTIAAVGLLFHFTQLVDISCSSDWVTYLTSLGIRHTAGLLPPSICLITQYFVHKVGKRAKEFRQCLKNNLACEQLDQVVLLNETDLSDEWAALRGNEKVKQVILGTRLTYRDLLKYTYESVPPNTIVIYANADIYCTKTLTELYTVDMRDKLFALLRWDEQEGSVEPKLFGPRPDSQDAWILYSDSVKSRTWDWDAFHYKLGVAGCDNRFTGDMFGMKFLVSNPCHSIKTIHIHKTEIRDYNKYDILPAKLYLYIHPCSITHINQCRINECKLGKFEPRNTSVTIKSLNPKQAQTYAVMLARENKYKWSHETATIQTQPALELSKFTDAFVSASGLVYDYKKTHIGAAEKSDVFITKSDIPFRTAFFSPCETVETMLAIPAPLQSYFTNPDQFCLQYLSYVLQFFRKYPETEFTMYLPPALQTLAQTFVFRSDASGTAIKAVAWSPDVTVYAKTAYGILPELLEPSVHELAALRSAWPPYQPTATTNNCVILTDDVFTEDFSKSLESLVGLSIVCIGRKEYGLDIYHKLVGARMCILFNLPKQDTDWMKLWCLPKGCPTLEFQNELKVVGEFQHFAAAAELDCWCMPLYKGPVDDLQKQIGAQVDQWVKLNPLSSSS